MFYKLNEIKPASNKDMNNNQDVNQTENETLISNINNTNINDTFENQSNQETEHSRNKPLLNNCKNCSFKRILDLHSHHSVDFEDISEYADNYGFSNSFEVNECYENESNKKCSSLNNLNWPNENYDNILNEQKHAKPDSKQMLKKLNIKVKKKIIRKFSDVYDKNSYMERLIRKNGQVNINRINIASRRRKFISDFFNTAIGL